MSPVRRLHPTLLLAILAACTDAVPTGSAPLVDPDPAFLVTCTASPRDHRVSCGSPGGGATTSTIYGGQNSFVRLTSSNVAYDGGTETFRFDVTVQNLLRETVGAYGESLAAAEGIRVFFHAPLVVTDGTGEVSVANPDGTATFTAANQPFFQYGEVLTHDQVSSARSWEFTVPGTVNTFSFVLAISAPVQPRLVINEVLANPGGTITDSNGEWFEVYNDGTWPVDLQGYVIADSAASGRRPYHLINASVVVPSGGYVVFGNTTDTSLNGGVPVDYAYGAALALANSLDAVKLARVVGTDTLTIDRVQYSSAAISAQNGISRELKNPALDNTNMDSSNWADAVVSAVYGEGGRGTPGAQNSTFVP